MSVHIEVAIGVIVKFSKQMSACVESFLERTITVDITTAI